MKEYGLFIDGKWESAKDGRMVPSIDPATEEAWVNVAAADSVVDVNKAVAAAKRAHESGVWRKKSPAARAEILMAVATNIFAKAEELAHAESRDSGGTIRKANIADIPTAGQAFIYYGEAIVGQPAEEEFEEDIPVISKNIVRREPVGVVAAIVPFNFPLAAAVWKVAPALAAGNTMVLKPSPYTPVTALMLAEICFESGVPAGVLNVITSPDTAVGEALVTHPDVDKVAFTGSTSVGRRVMEAASRSLKPVLLELGGKSANIILEDADLDAAAAGAVFGTFFHTGQICESGTRLLVPQKIQEEFIGKMINVVKGIKIGNPLDEAIGMGPLVSAQQLENTKKYVAIGKNEGAKIAYGGGRPKDLAKGYFHEPTIFTGVTNEMTIAREEIFGPVVSVITYKDDEDALRIANDSIYGLGGAVWSRDIARAKSLADRMQTGTVWINDYHLLNIKYPFGGYKQSGFGRELGHYGLAEFQQVKHIHVGQPGSIEDKSYFGLLLD